MESSRQPATAELQPRKTHRRNYLLALAGCAALPLLATAAIGGAGVVEPAKIFGVVVVVALLVLYVIGLIRHVAHNRGSRAETNSGEPPPTPGRAAI